MIPVKKILYLFDLNGKPLRALKTVYDLEVEYVSEDIDTMTFKLPIEEKIIPEQEILYKNNKYIVKEIEDVKSESKTAIMAHSLSTELNGEMVPHIEVEGSFLADTLERILARTSWEVGHLDYDDKQYFLSEENKSALFLLRLLSKISELQIEFDTINRKVNMKGKLGKDLDFIFRYRKNIKEIKKRTTSPKATILYPIGRGGLGIQSVNDGIPYVEDFSWYESLGISLREAKKKYRKAYEWKDERYINAGNLMRAGQERLRFLSHPQIAYEVETSFLDREVGIGDYGYIVDEEIGIKVKVRVVRLVERDNENNNLIEFNYLIPTLELSDSTSDSTSGTAGKDEVVLVKNREDFSTEISYNPLIELSFTSFAPTNAFLGVLIVGQASTSMLLEGMYTLNGERIGSPIKQRLSEGWHTLSYNFIITQLQEGSKELNLMLRSDTGQFTVLNGEAELFIRAENLLGGVTSTLPRASKIDEVYIPNTKPFNIIDDGAIIEFKEETGEGDSI